MSDDAFLQVASVLIERDGKFLLVQEGSKKSYEKWNWPGGHVDPGETLEQGAAREAYEETGYRVEVGVLIRSVARPETGRRLNTFTATIVSEQEGELDDDILQIQWFTYDELVAMKTELRDQEHIFKAIEEYRAL